jgi:hypothetical protein
VDEEKNMIIDDEYKKTEERYNGVRQGYLACLAEAPHARPLPFRRDNLGVETEDPLYFSRIRNLVAPLIEFAEELKRDPRFETFHSGIVQLASDIKRKCMWDFIHRAYDEPVKMPEG